MNLENSRYAQWPLAALIFVAAISGSALAHQLDRPISSALLCVVGVTVIGAMTGLRSGLVAAVLASAIYNFFLSDPLLQFSATSADEYIPLIAFNVTAIVSGVLAGRLNDRARAAERAQGQLNALLSVSDSLQKAVSLKDIASAINDSHVASWWGRFELYDSEGHFVSEEGQKAHWQEVVRYILADSDNAGDFSEVWAYRLQNASGVLGVAVFERLSERRHEGAIDVSALMALLAMAVERCTLLEKQSEAEALRRSEAFKTALLSSLSHDMRTPLSAISASASSLRHFAADLDPDMSVVRTFGTTRGVN